MPRSLGANSSLVYQNMAIVFSETPNGLCVLTESIYNVGIPYFLAVLLDRIPFALE